MFYLHSLKVEHYVLQSPCPEGGLRRGKGGARIYRSFCSKNQVVEHQKITVN